MEVKTNGGLKPVLISNLNFQPEANLHADGLIWLDGYSLQSHMKNGPFSFRALIAVLV